MSELPAFGLANTITGFATLFAGLTCLVLDRLVHPQPARWRLAYWMITVTGVFTVTLHGFGETSPWGPRWFWSFLDTGSNIVVAGVIALAVLGDDAGNAASHRRARVALVVATAIGVAWHFVDRLPGTERHYLVPLGAWGGFYPGEAWLIALSWVTVVLFYRRRDRIPPRAKPLLRLTVAIFFCGMLLATASNEKIVPPFFAMHALWHLVGAFGFVCFWAFNHVRFADTALSERSGR